MKKNPYSKGVSFRTPVIASELRVGNTGSRFVGRDGHINAGGDKDLAKQVAAFLQAVSQSGAVTEETASERAALVAKRREYLQAAFHDKETHVEIGETLADELYQAANREGFARRFLARQELKQGQRPEFRMRMKNQSAVVATSATQVHSTIIRDNIYFPQEIYIEDRLFVEQRDLDTSTGDPLEEKYLEGLEGIMVAEDRLWRQAALATVGISNPLTLFSSTVTAGGLMTLRNQVGRWNIPVAHWLFANDVWSDVVSDPSFQQNIDQVSKHELLMVGQLGVMFGMNVYSDAYRHPEHKVLSQGEMFCVGAQINHGQYTDRGGVNSTPLDVSHERIPGRGWHLVESFSMLLGNTRSVARGVRS